MSVFRHIDDARHLVPGARCKYTRCLDAPAYWLVSPDDRAIVAYCQYHAEATISEYHATASAHPDEEELAALALWRMVPVTMAGGAA